MTRHQKLQVVTVAVPCSRADDLVEAMREEMNLEPIQIERPESSIAWIELYSPDARQAARIARQVRARWPDLHLESGRRDAREWLSFWRHHFKTTDIGRRLRIAPVWERVSRKGPRRFTIRVDPGASFGTGDHFTTRFCLEMIDRLFERSVPDAFLDVGTGSGILAIAAAKLGCKQCLGTEHDPLALRQAVRNVRLNRVGKHVIVRLEDLAETPPAKRYDVVAANLVSGLLMTHASELASVAGRWLIMSGIREFEADAVAETFIRLGGQEVLRDGDGEWTGILMEMGKSK